MRKKIAFAVAIMLTSATGVAHATDDFSGAYLGGHVGYGHGKYDFSGTDGTTAANFSGVGAEGHAVGLLAGYGKSFDNKYVGFEVDGSLSEIDVTGAVGAWNGKVSIKDTVAANLRLGIAPTQDYLLFVKGGIANSKIKASVTNGTTTASASERIGGVQLGVGMDGNLGNTWRARGEYTYTNYSNVSATNGASSLKVSPNSGVFRLALIKSF